jgi:hypothetical protein
MFTTMFSDPENVGLYISFSVSPVQSNGKFIVFYVHLSDVREVDWKVKS